METIDKDTLKQYIEDRLITIDKMVNSEDSTNVAEGISRLKEIGEIISCFDLGKWKVETIK